MRTISDKEIAQVQGASGLLTVVLGRVENVGTAAGGALLSTGVALNDTVFSVVQLDGDRPELDLGQLLPKLI